MTWTVDDERTLSEERVPARSGLDAGWIAERRMAVAIGALLREDRGRTVAAVRSFIADARPSRRRSVVRRISTARSSMQRKRAAIRLSWSAAALLAIGASIWFAMSERSSGTRSRDVAVAGGSVLRLDDGTVVRAGDHADLHRLPDGPGVRLRLTRGRIDADVHPQPHDQPLTIQVPQGTVTVMGTRFALVVSQEQSRLEVEHGLVRMANRAGSIDIPAGRSGVILASSSPSLLADSAAAVRLRWGMPTEGTAAGWWAWGDPGPGHISGTTGAPGSPGLSQIAWASPSEAAWEVPSGARFRIEAQVPSGRGDLEFFIHHATLGNRGTRVPVAGEGWRTYEIICNDLQPYAGAPQRPIAATDRFDGWTVVGSSETGIVRLRRVELLMPP